MHQYSTNDSDLAFGASLGATVESLPDGIILNELMAANRGSVKNGDTNPDWIELYNPTSREIDLTGAGLGDGVNEKPTYFSRLEPGSPRRRTSSCGAMTRRNSPACTPDSPSMPTAKTSRFGGRARTAKIQDAIGFGLQADDLSIGRSPDGAGPWALNAPTPAPPTPRRIWVASSRSPSTSGWPGPRTATIGWRFTTAPPSVPMAGLKLSDDPAQLDKPCCRR